MRAKLSRSPLAHIRQKIADTLRGRSLSQEHRANISIGLQGRVASEETRSKIGQANATKRFIVTDPDGSEHYVTNLSQFCREHGLNTPNLLNVAKGKRPHHRGWTCRYE
jgi:hypothetical protein